MYARYALYFTPPPGPFAQAGAAWFEKDIAKRPRRYGFHATLKAPFRLAQGATREALRAAVEGFCAQTPPVLIDGLEVTQSGRLLALTPLGETDALEVFAAQVVARLDPFRAPLSDAETTRRRGKGLPEAAEARLQRWGYPHVMEAFAFHMTLTGPLPRAGFDQIANDARAHFAPCLPCPLTLDALTLCGEDGAGQFHALARVPLSA
jgi:hypothetical protein